jgi:hypothetical protein
VKYDVTASSFKIVTVGMFLWAVKCGFISENTLCDNLFKLHGALLFQAVSLCHGSGLVDEDIKGFVRCVCCILSDCVIGFAIELWGACIVCLVSVCCLCLCVGA